jgi:hypothetical protein
VNGVVSSHNKQASDVILFIIGGATFEETTKIAEINAAASKVGREGGREGGRERMGKRSLRGKWGGEIGGKEAAFQRV